MTRVKSIFILAAGVFLTCLPVAVQASTENLFPGTKEQPAEFDLSESSVFLTEGGYYDISGSRDDIITDSIQFNPAATKTFYITLRHVHIDTSDVEGEYCGLFIPAGINVELTLYGTSTIAGSVYGIFVSEDATLTIKNELDEVFTIRGDNGIYNLGNYLMIDGDTSVGDLGSTGIYAKYYGIYSPAGLHLKNTDMKIVVTGSATDEQPVAGMALGQPNAKQSDLSGNVVDIDASQGKNTYGIWLRNAESCFCGWLTLNVSATGCVLHRENQYTGFVMETANLTLNGPFDSHHEQWTGDWYCDDGIAIDEAQIPDGSDYPFHGDHSGLNKLSIIGRTLYRGWNTLCLPFEYAVSGTGDDPDEARNWIDDFTAYAGNNEVVGEDGTTAKMLVFKTITEPSLMPDKAYLVHVNDDMLDSGQDEVVVKFTASTKQIGRVHDRSGEYLKTVYRRLELANTDSIFKLGRKVGPDGEVTNYFNHSRGASVDAYRAYIKTDTPMAESKLLVSFNDETTTAVETIDCPAGISVENGSIIYNARTPAVLNIYTVSGSLARRINAHEGRNIISALPKGIYIVDGKKVAVW
ncbi:MAG: hypothetical protein LUI08_04460 [Prevotella sp.]|nr:hypothetical protein [Prevotella sp.]